MHTPRLRALCGLGLLAACAPADETPPVLVSAQFEDQEHLRLRFSEAIAAVDEVDASTHFRVGSAFYVEELGVTAYYDLAHHFPDGVPGVEGALGQTWQRHGLTLVARVEAGARDDELVLTLSYPLEPYVCDVLPEAAQVGIPGGVHLHYAEASRPRITDLAGNPLADNGGWWVESTFATTREGAFPELDPRMAIPCPPLP